MTNLGQIEMQSPVFALEMCSDEFFLKHAFCVSLIPRQVQMSGAAVEPLLSASNIYLKSSNPASPVLILWRKSIGGIKKIVQ